MYSYLSRAETYYDENDSEACGTISYLLWGGKAGLRWSQSKLKELGEIELTSIIVDDNFAILDDRLAYSTQKKAEEMAKNIGCSGFHVHEFEGKKWYMPCEKHSMAEIGQEVVLRKALKLLKVEHQIRIQKVKELLRVTHRQAKAQK